MGGQGYIDARTDAVGDTIEASICIVGSGAAGLTLVRRLGETLSDVVLIESGGLEFDRETQNLYAGRMLGLHYFDLDATRLRYFGGTTNHWGGNCRALAPIDFEARASVGLPGWPVARADLQPYVEEAAAGLGIHSPFLDAPTLMRAAGIDPDGLVERSSQVLDTRAVQIARDIRLGRRYRDEIAANQRVRVYLNLSAIHVQLAPDAASVDHLACATLTGKRVTVRARIFVLCCHAIENARLLLTSNDVEGSGIANRSGHVGRYFMEHPRVWASKWVPSDRFPTFYNYHFAETKWMDVHFGLSDRILRENDLLQYTCRLTPVYAEAETMEALGRVRRNFMEPGDISFLRDLAKVAGGASDIAESWVATRGYYFAKPLYYDLEHTIEQAPNPNSRVVVSDRRDALGSPVADLDWQLAEADYRTFRKGHDLVGAELAALGWGRLMPEDVTPDVVRSQVSGVNHHVGTTRMSAAASGGVVDSDCKVHGVANLYIGGSSVFPSTGGGSPTMMIIALCLRMAEQLRRRLAG